MKYALAEHSYKDLFDSMLDGIEVVDATTGRIVLANKVAATLFGFDSPEDMIGIDPLDYIPVEEDKTHIATMFAETFEKDLHKVVELRVRRRDGAEFWIAAMGAKVHFDGRLASLASLRDITAHKLTEKNLREVEDRQIQLWNNSSELIAVTQDRKIVFANRRFKKVFALPRQALTGLSILDIAHPDDRQALAERYQRILSGGSPSPSSMLRGIDGHGKTWWGEFREVPFMWKGEPAIMSLIQDVTERKRADEALRHSERHYRLLAENLSDVVWTMDTSLNYTYISPSVTRLRGYSVEEAMAQTLEENMTPSSLQTMTQAMAEENAKDAAGQSDPDRSILVELELSCKDGSTIWTENRVSYLRDAAGRITDYLGVTRDISERKRSEKALQASEERFRAVFEKSPIGIVVYDGVGTAVAWNKACLDIFGLSDIGEARTPPLFDDPTLTDKAKQALRMGKTLSWEGPLDLDKAREAGVYHTAKSGTICLRGMMTALGGDNERYPGGYIGLVEDITERKRTEEALRVSEERFSRAFDASPAIMTIISLKDGRYVEVNRAYERLTGYRRDEVVGRTFSEVALWSNPEEVERAFHDLPTVGGHRNREVQFHSKTGESRVALLSTEVVEFGSESCVLTAAEDITERKEAEAREKKALEEIALSSRLASVGRLASGVAHEINNPLTVVIGCSQMLMGKDLPQDIKEDVHLVYDSAQHVAGIVKGLLTFARGSKPGRNYVDINILVSRVLGLRAHEMSIYNIEVTTKFAPDLPETLADAGQIQQVFLNIILNAEQSMTKAHNGGNLEIRTARTGDSIRITFKDDGVGIAKEDLSRLFEPFFTTKEVGEGTGLGLSISYGIIQEHHGRIYARGKPGKGATFVIELPIVAKPDQPEPPDEEPAEEPERKVTGRVLVVDDEPAVCRLLSEMLAQEGHKVETVGDADAALEEMKRKRFGLVLLDIRMKGINGFDLYEQMGKIALSLQKRVLFITGDTLSPDTRGFLEKTEAPYVSKPFDVRQLMKSVNQILAQG